MKKILTLSLILFSTFIGAESLSPLPVPENHAEALFARRIVTLWKDEAGKSLVEGQIQKFIQEHPKSHHIPNFRIMLGDLAASHNQWSYALQCYEEAALPDLTFSKRMNALYQAELYDELCQALSPFATKHDSSTETLRWKLLYAEATFKKGVREGDLKLIQQASKQCEELSRTALSFDARLLLAQTAYKMGDKERATELYLTLAEEKPQERQSLLFSAARVLASYDLERALKTLQTIDTEGSPNHAIQKARLLFDIKAYQALIDIAGDLKNSVSSKSRFELDYLLGQSYFVLHQHKRATETLIPLISEKSPLTEELQQKAAVSIVASFAHLSDINQTLRFTNQMVQTWPDSNESASALFILAALYEERSQFDRADETLDKICEISPSDGILKAKFRKGQLLYKKGQWAACRQSMLSYKKSFPNSPFISSTNILMIQSFIKEYEAGDKEKLVSSVDTILETIQEGSIDDSQRGPYLLKIAQVLYDMRLFESAEKLLEPLTKEKTLAAQAHLLLGLCKKQGENDLLSFVAHAEKALQLDPALPNRAEINLNLFAAYFTLSISNAENQKHLQDSAARHLYTASQLEPSLVSKKNLVWLGNHHFLALRDFIDPYAPCEIHQKEILLEAKKTADIYKKALGFADKPILRIKKDTLFLESAALNLASLWGATGKTEDQKKLLKELHQKQTQKTDWPWTLKTQTLFSLGRSIEASNPEKALQTFKTVIEKRGHVDPHLLSAANLYYARLLWKKGERTHDDASTETALKIFNRLRMRKLLLQEPIHLEAAIDYALCLAETDPTPSYPEKLSALLIQAKHHFSKTDDIWSKDYLAAREMYPEKERLYQAYMMLIDAHIARLKASLSNNLEQKANVDAAKSLYTTLLDSHFAVSKYLVDQAQSGLNAVNKINSHQRNLFSDL